MPSHYFTRSDTWRMSIPDIEKPKQPKLVHGNEKVDDLKSGRKREQTSKNEQVCFKTRVNTNQYIQADRVSN